jgi:hypothetical protein
MSEIELREKLEALGFFTAIEGHPVVAIEVDRAIAVFAPVLAARDAEIARMHRIIDCAVKPRPSGGGVVTDVK